MFLKQAQNSFIITELGINVNRTKQKTINETIDSLKNTIYDKEQLVSTIKTKQEILPFEEKQLAFFEKEIITCKKLIKQLSNIINSPIKKI
jgi:biotin-(acetyl-CoA carboxylase) ligase